MTIFMSYKGVVLLMCNVGKGRGPGMKRFFLTLHLDVQQ